MLQTNYAMPTQGHNSGVPLNYNGSPIHSPDDDNDNNRLYSTRLCANANTLKAFVPKPSFWKSLWNGIKSLFIKTAEKANKATVDDLKDITQTTIDVYDFYDKVTTNPNTNYISPQVQQMRFYA